MAMLNKICSRRKLTRRELRNLNIEIGFFEGLVRRDPTYCEALQVLGVDYSRRGDFSKAVHIHEQLADQLPTDPIVLYNLACCYSQTRQLRRAADALDRAIALGYKNFRTLAKDPDLANLRKHAVFKRVRARIVAVTGK